MKNFYILAFVLGLAMVWAGFSIDGQQPYLTFAGTFFAVFSVMKVTKKDD